MNSKCCGRSGLRRIENILCLCDRRLGDVGFNPFGGSPRRFGGKVGATTMYPHKTIWRQGGIRIKLLQDDSEACLPHVQKQRMRQLLPLPTATGAGAQNRTTTGIMYGLLRKLPTHYGPIAHGRAVAADPARLPGAVEPAGVCGRDGFRPMDAAGAGCRGERNAVHGVSQRGSRRASGGRGVCDFPRTGV
jgi:hypothetical protein